MKINLYEQNSERLSKVNIFKMPSDYVNDSHLDKCTQIYRTDILKMWHCYFRIGPALDSASKKA